MHVHVHLNPGWLPVFHSSLKIFPSLSSHVYVHMYTCTVEVYMYTCTVEVYMYTCTVEVYMYTCTHVL